MYGASPQEIEASLHIPILQCNKHARIVSLNASLFSTLLLWWIRRIPQGMRHFLCSSKCLTRFKQSHKITRFSRSGKA